MNQKKRPMLLFIFFVIFYLNVGRACGQAEVVNSTYNEVPLQCAPTHKEESTWKRIKDRIDFFINFVKDPKHTGSLAPSSSALSKEITHCIDAKQKGKYILEVGPGTGSFTKQIIKKLHPEDTLCLVEYDKHFYEKLVERYGDLPNVHIYNCGIEQWECGQLKFDYIISGLPFNAFEPSLVLQILAKYLSIIAPDGQIAYFEYIFFPTLKRLGYGALCHLVETFEIDAPEFMNAMRSALATLKVTRKFKSSCRSCIETTVPLNLTPARVITCSP